MQIEFMYKPEFFQCLDEFARGKQTVLRISPSGKGFKPAYASFFSIHDRLIENLNMTVFDSAVQMTDYVSLSQLLFMQFFIIYDV